ncbi:MAG: NADH-quinone oxidoreductase subunit L [Gammaproteobacteria bacterium]|nr:NADH-quinone oxidoreductase subunit L [Gammaproteobacteria bacterium]
MQNTILLIVFAPLIGALFCGFLGAKLGKRISHWVAVGGVLISFLASAKLLFDKLLHAAPDLNFTLYNWASFGDLTFSIGFLVDGLSLIMINVVTFVSLMVHIYTIGYMKNDSGYHRFFSYISLFTFAMLMLVLANNFLQLFFGWEAVGLVSYLLIGFWFKKDSAVFANLKAFLVNRVGDFGFLVGIAAILYLFNSLDYATIFQTVSQSSDSIETINIGFGDWSIITFICICLFIGAMGKSAQVPLHVWLPDSMEGPTPISALIHAATMVTAGVFMVARMSPLFELSDTALSFVLFIGAITALSMGILGIIQNDIKRIIAYSTLSQLGYMVAALGASAYAASIFHLMTHAFFKALLFLAAGSVIIGMHHIQDIRKMGGLRRYMPITYICSLIGSLALIGMPLFSGFYSKDAIIESVHYSEQTFSSFAYWCLLIGIFITAIYSTRLLMLVFHTKERFSPSTKRELHESPRVIIVPLILLAIPSIGIGWLTMEPLLFGDFFASSIFVLPDQNGLAIFSRSFTSVGEFTLHALQTLPFWLMLSGVMLTIYVYKANPAFVTVIQRKLKIPLKVLENNYYFDKFNQTVLVQLSTWFGQLFYRIGDKLLIDGLAVNGSARFTQLTALIIRKLQSGYLYHYVLLMLLGLLIALGWLLWPLQPLS